MSDHKQRETMEMPVISTPPPDSRSPSVAIEIDKKQDESG
jgi:hypothetical protein